MRQLLVTLAALLISGAAFAAVDVNTASEAELDGIKGIGPSLSGRILKARQQGPFKDWRELMQRVKGIQPRSAHQLSAAGLTVNGAGYEATTGPAQPPTRAP
jgi:competence protein ComEA